MIVGILVKDRMFIIRKYFEPKQYTSVITKMLAWKI